jgi:hypothetical protein
MTMEVGQKPTNLIKNGQGFRGTRGKRKLDAWYEKNGVFGWVLVWTKGAERERDEGCEEK